MQTHSSSSFPPRLESSRNEPGLGRRRFLFGLAAILGAPALARAGLAPGQDLRLAASWQLERGYRVGVLDLDTAGAMRVAAGLDVPTRAHGLLREPGGSLLAVARRPGDWLLRWDGAGRAVAWRWIEPGRAFAGHVLASPDGSTVYTTEIDLETGAGLIGVRAAATLAKQDEWPTHGIDPHELLWDVTRPGAFVVANGGVPTRPETGRVKHDLERMDSSLVRIDAASGALLGQWRLADPRLSLRHLAWNRGRLGIALQAEHDDGDARASAPVLALLEDNGLRTVAAPPLAGYGGSVAALGDGFAVACPRAQSVALYGAEGFVSRLELAEACALAGVPGRVWAGGRDRALAADAGSALPRSVPVPAIRLDNHWIAL